MLAQADKWRQASSYRWLVKAAVRGTLGCSPDKERGQRRLWGSRCWPDGAWLEHHREAHCTPSWGCRAFQAPCQGHGTSGSLAAASWVTLASPGAERNRRMGMGAGQTLHPGCDSSGAETAAQARDSRRLGAAGRRRRWFGGQTHPRFPFACGRARPPQCCQNGGPLCPGPCPAPCHHSCLIGGAAWASRRSVGSCHRWQGGCEHRGGWNWAEGGEEETGACLVCIMFT